MVSQDIHVLLHSPRPHWEVVSEVTHGPSETQLGPEARGSPCIPPAQCPGKPLVSEVLVLVASGQIGHYSVPGPVTVT